MRGKVTSYYLAPDLDGNVCLYYARVYIAKEHLSLHLYRHPLAFEAQRESARKARAIGNGHSHGRLDLTDELVAKAVRIAGTPKSNRHYAPDLYSAVVRALNKKVKSRGKK